MITLTDKLIEQGRSSAGDWNKKQLEILGVAWPTLLLE